MANDPENTVHRNAAPRTRPEPDDDAVRHPWTRYRTLLDDDDDLDWDLGPEESPYLDDVPGASPPPRVKD